MQFSIEDVKVVSYLNIETLAGSERKVNLMPLWDGQKWHWWVPKIDSGLVEMAVPDTIEGDYVAAEPAKDSDLFIPFVHIAWQRASWPEICPFISAICDDLHNMGSSVAKLRCLFDFRTSLPRGAGGRFASTELDYLVILARTVFDLLQEMISIIWRSRVRLLEPAAEARRRAGKLPSSFSKIVLQDKNQLRSCDEIAKKFGLPAPLAHGYAAAAPFFSRLRDHRDMVIHGLATTSSVFVTERGFCINPKDPPFSSFNGWRPEHFYNANIVSLLPWVADIVHGTIDACSELLTTFASTIEFPPDIAPGYKVFVRGPYAEDLANVLRIRSGAPSWWG